MNPTVIATELPRVSHADALAIGTLLDTIWPHDDRGPEDRARKLIDIGNRYEGPAQRQPLSLVVWDDSLVVAHALVFERVITLGPKPLSALALAGVATHPDCRGRGLGEVVVQAAFDRVDQGLFPLSLFQTSLAVENFYTRLGAKRVENPVVNSHNADDPNTNPFWDDIVMRYPAGGAWSDETIDLCGPGY
ncbi:GNAT family N-acetyltransferase [Botrimarina hoheduenensis]|nr:GNAT family N-acetyltransferase [Botrimarina hoheduenensis]